MIDHLFFKMKTFLNYRLKAVNAHGLHSPFLFDFYREVISAKKEFYFFKKLRLLIKSYNSVSESDILFLYRLVIFFKANSVCVLNSNFPVSIALSVASLNKMLFLSRQVNFTKEESTLLSNFGVSLSYSNGAELLYLDRIDKFSLNIINDYRFVVIRGPYFNKTKNKIWQNLCELNSVRVSIDLYQFGILLLNKNQAKQHFVVKM